MTFGLWRQYIHSILSKHRIHKRKTVFNHRNKSSTMCECEYIFVLFNRNLEQLTDIKLFLMNDSMANSAWVYFSWLLVIIISVCRTRLNFRIRGCIEMDIFRMISFCCCCCCCPRSLFSLLFFSLPQKLLFFNPWTY